MASTRRRGRSPQVNSKLLTHYVEYLRRDQCVAQATLVIRRNFVAPFLDSIGELAMPSRLHRVSAKAIHDYVITKSPPLHRASKKHLTSSLRSFLRFAHVKGYLKRPLMNAVPVIATRKLDRLPRGMPWKSVQALLRVAGVSFSINPRLLLPGVLLVTFGATWMLYNKAKQVQGF